MGNLIWREPKVKEETGLSKSTRWRLMKVGEFPQKVQLGPRAVGWRAEEIVQWCRDRCEAKNAPVGKHKGEAGRDDPETRRKG
jgi:prophage regulatory protein